MFSFILSLTALFAFANSLGQFNVLQHPESIEFKGHDSLKESLLPEVYSAALGYTTEQDSNWPGMYLINPFNLAKTIVTVVVDGIPSLEVNNGYYFPLHTDLDESEIFNSLENRIQERTPKNDRRVLRVDLSDTEDQSSILELFKNLKTDDKIQYSFLKLDAEEDRKFIEDLQILSLIANGLETGSITRANLPQVFWIKVASLHALSDVYGANSTTVTEAKHLLSEVLLRINRALKKASTDVFFTVVTSDASHTRRTRRAAGKADQEDLNLAKVYSEDYPVIFNIILWFSIVFFFSLLAISIFIADMDPGRDSIIYRMTNTRMKKDN